jgi:DNA helicase-2/ATP-dependent DNA helicase PcrA
VKDAMRDVGIDEKRFEPRTILGSISRTKGDAMMLSSFREQASEYYQELVLRVWERYEQKLADSRALDFDDLLLRTVHMLKGHSDILAQYHDRFRYIHIDEYQDTNRVQYELARLLAGTTMNICVVGDVDQTIYSWRGANLDNLLRFEKTFPGTKVVMLEQNYRSTKTILDASNAVIAKNVNRFEKRLFTENSLGEPIALVGCYDETEEANFVAGKAHELITRGVEPREIAVLYRANFQSRALEEACLSMDIPYQVLGVRFFERREIKDVLAFIRVAQHSDRTSDLARIVNVPPRGIGKVTLLKIIEGREDELGVGPKKRVAAFKKTLQVIAEAVLTKPPSEAIKVVLRESGLEEHLSGGSEEDMERLENIRELVTLATRYDKLPLEEGIEQLLADAALATDQDELRDDRNAVRLMTVHAAKGLEFDYVIITGLEEGLFPHEGFDEKRDEEEERRLFYVALTRARKKVFLAFASVRTIFGSRTATVPSSFIGDIDDALLEIGDTSSREAPRETIIEID